ncbi:hypothetical protein [Shewanella atlantica]|uniref:hypothetical protein n=2 Tax=Shewanella TaxID=22 RepID=UPI003734DB64
MDAHKVTQARVTDSFYRQEEFIDANGDKRTRDNYYLSYQFELEGEEFFNTVKISSERFLTLEAETYVSVCYSIDDPELSGLKSHLTSGMDNGQITEHLLTALRLSVPCALIFYFIMSSLLNHESKNLLPKGLYSENSWLNLEDRNLVLKLSEQLVYFDFDDKQSAVIERAYDQHWPAENLIAMSRPDRLKRINFDDISSVSSDHNSAVIEIEHVGGKERIEFISHLVKSHALDRLKPFIPDHLGYHRNERTRLKAALPSMAFLSFLTLAGLVVNIGIFQFLMGFMAVFIALPTVISRITDPTITEKWCPEEAFTGGVGYTGQ